MAEFLESGGFDKHLKQLRVALWRSVEASREEVLRIVSRGHARQPAAKADSCSGSNCPTATTASRSSARPPPLGINILPGAVFSPSEQYRNCIRIACGHPFEVLKPAIRTIATVIAGGA